MNNYRVDEAPNILKNTFTNKVTLSLQNVGITGDYSHTIYNPLRILWTDFYSYASLSLDYSFKNFNFHNFIK